MSNEVLPARATTGTLNHRNSSYKRHWRPSNLTFDYFHEEGVKGHLSKQYPTIANPAPLGLCAFALTTFVLSMMNAGVIVGLYSSRFVDRIFHLNSNCYFRFTSQFKRGRDGFGFILWRFSAITGWDVGI
jgi:hypothetical protein